MPESTELLKNLVLLMARTYRQTLTADEASTYVEWCKGIPQEALGGVFLEAMEASPAFMPTGPGISAVWKAREPKTDNLQADREWNLITAYVDHHICSLDHLPPRGLTDKATYALRQIGGIEAVYDCYLEKNGQSQADLKWRGKDFREAYGRYAETGGLKAIGREEAKHMLDIAKRGHLMAGETQ